MLKLDKEDWAEGSKDALMSQNIHLNFYGDDLLSYSKCVRVV